MKYESEIMNIQSEKSTMEYLVGHKEARHKAAEIACKADAEIERLKAENAYLKEREKKIAKVLGVTDGGKYINDWQSRVEHLIKNNTEGEKK